MVRTQTMVQLTEDLVALLDRRAARDGVSRSHVIREAVETYLAEDVERLIDEQIVEGYTRVPQGGDYDVDEWGDLGAAVTSMTAELLRALDDEERDQGVASW